VERRQADAKIGRQLLFILMFVRCDDYLSLLPLLFEDSNRKLFKFISAVFILVCLWEQVKRGGVLLN
jgi:hypothetical protein